jgi:L-alanine-DL-glutamate epimerase-like enolase superfamily enzyme
VRLTASDGLEGLGESAPSSRYGETPEGSEALLHRIDPARLHEDDRAETLSYLETLGPGAHSAKGAVDMALLDLAAKRAGLPLSDHLGLGFREGVHVTSFSIGLDDPEVTRQKAAEAAAYPILKLKVGGPRDRENLAAVRDAAPTARLRVDANEAWASPEDALRNIEWLAKDTHVEFVEQPMPASTPPQGWRWLRARSPLRIMADESCASVRDLPLLAECFDSVNVKLAKVGGPTRALNVLRRARAAGLQTMLGCMIESSVLISAAAHLAELTDYLDLDGNLLVSNDPYRGVRSIGGVLSFAGAPVHTGLCVAAR